MSRECRVPRRSPESAACLVSVVLLGSVSSVGADAVDDEVQREIAALRADLDEVRAQRDGSTWLTAERTAEIREIVRDTLADADGRTSLADSGAFAGWDKGFVFRSADGNWSLRVGGFTQFRWEFNQRENPPSGQNEDNWGFVTARSKLTFSGGMIDPTWMWRMQLSVGSTDSTLVTDDVWVQKELAAGVFLRVGQQRFPWLREDEISESSTLFVERSALNWFFRQNRSDGMRLEVQQDAWRVFVGYSNGMLVSGEGSPQLTTPSPIVTGGVTNGIAPNNVSNTDYCFSGRAEWKLGGRWEQFDDMSSYHGEDGGAVLGIAAMGQQNRPNSPANGGGDANSYGVTADANIDLGSGASLFAWGAYRRVENVTNNAGTIRLNDNGSANQWGFQIQAGFFVTEAIELAVRCEYGDSGYVSNTALASGVVTQRTGGGDTLSVATAGATYHIQKTRIKLSAEVSYVFDTLQDFANPSAGYYKDAPGSNGQTVVRAQVQWMF